MAITRVFDLLPYNLQHFAKADMLGYKQSGQWAKYATQTVIDTINEVSYGLLELGIKKDAKIAIMWVNRPEWNS